MLLTAYRKGGAKWRRLATSEMSAALRTSLLTAGALIAFAANSWLCRAALRTRSIDPATFTALRIASGAVVLLLIFLARSPRPRALQLAGSWGSAGALFAYAVASRSPISSSTPESER